MGDTSKESARLQEISASEVLAKIKNKEPVEYDHVIIRDDIDLSQINLEKENGKYVVDSSITVTNSRIEGRVNFSETAFNESVTFTRTIFNEDASFKKAKFSGIVDFGIAIFSGDANFGGAAFSEDAFFGKAIFSGDANFGEATFSMFVTFREAAFSKYSTFAQATIRNYADFVGVIFSDTALFIQAIFSGIIDFEKSTFTGYPSFSEAAFNGDIKFVGASFVGANFTGSTFTGNTNFEKATFNGWNTAFEKVTFTGNTTFDKVTFKGNITFERATFTGITAFEKATFSQRVCFSLSQFNGDRLTFRDAKFPDPVSQEEACRKAKIVLEKAGNREDAGYHFYREMDAKRKQKPWYIRDPEYIFVQGLFGYGVHPYRLLFWWFAIILAFAGLYWAGNGIEGDISGYEYIWFSITTAVTPGYAGYSLNPGFPIVAGIEAIFGTFMWASFIATFARKYMR